MLIALAMLFVLSLLGLTFGLDWIEGHILEPPSRPGAQAAGDGFADAGRDRSEL